MWDSELRVVAKKEDKAHIVSVMVSETELNPISELKNQYMDEISSIHVTDSSYNFDTCGYKVINGKKTSVFTKYDAYRNAEIDTRITGEFHSVCKGIASHVPYSVWSSFLKPD
jgi:hypothetical protein